MPFRVYFSRWLPPGLFPLAREGCERAAESTAREGEGVTKLYAPAPLPLPHPQAALPRPRCQQYLALLRAPAMTLLQCTRERTFHRRTCSTAAWEKGVLYVHIPSSRHQKFSPSALLLLLLLVLLLPRERYAAAPLRSGCFYFVTPLQLCCPNSEHPYPPPPSLSSVHVYVR